MKKTSIPTFIGVFTSLLVIRFLHLHLVVEDCLKQKGEYDFETAKCQLAEGQFYESENTGLFLAIYFIVGFLVSLFISASIKKVFFSQSKQD